MTKRKADRIAEDQAFCRQSSTFRNPHIRQANFQTIKDGQINTRTTTSKIKTHSWEHRQPISCPPPSLEDELPSAEAPKKPTQNSQFIADFEEHHEELMESLLEHESDVLFGSDCCCGNGVRTTQCHDCHLYAASCINCYIRSHSNTPFHWPEVWDFERGYLVRHDISSLGHTIQLGHNGKFCPSPQNRIHFTVVDANGVHATYIAFCGCFGSRSKLQQLMQARLFPATTRDPKTAYTYTVLKQFQIHTQESKKAAYDYFGALRRLTDNAFTANVPDSYASFLRAAREWNNLTRRKRLGQEHGIDAVIRHRPFGNLIVYCPACPEPGFNFAEFERHIPGWARQVSLHLHQLQKTLDGNFQCNQMKKNCDPDDVSLCNGNGHFPHRDELDSYLASVQHIDEKSTCTYITAVNKQSQKKFTNMSTTGTVNAACSHVIIWSAVDLQFGERFVNVDLALAKSLRLRLPVHSERLSELEHEIILAQAESIDHVLSYDAMCQYWVNILDRFVKSFPDLVHIIQRMRKAIPALHVMGHKDDCIYLFGTAYMEAVAHFHGETAEHYWPEANQLGPQTRQMNSGHRHDTLIDHHNDWNWKKVMKMAATLSSELNTARTLYIQKRDHFRGLSALHSECVIAWRSLDRSTTRVGKQVQSVYRHTKSKIPSQAAVYQYMLSSSSGSSPANKAQSIAAVFLNEGIQIKHLQRKTIATVKEERDHCLASLKNEIINRRAKLQVRISIWRQQQKELMPLIADIVTQQLSSEIEDEILYLPSDFSQVDRLKYGLIILSKAEVELQEGAAFDALRGVQNAVKCLTALRDRKRRDARGQADNTRSGSYIRDAEGRRNLHIVHYAAARKALISLGMIGESDLNSLFPPLTLEDTRMKSTQRSRALGDSRRTDGRLWTLSGVSAPVTTSPLSGIQLSNVVDNPSQQVYDIGSSSGTIMPRRKRLPRPKQNSSNENSSIALPSVMPDANGPEGWLWNLGGNGKMTESEMYQWSEEGDRVQWFRAEAEMQRWKEQVEQKVAELLRTSRSFNRMQEVWTELAASNAEIPGKVAYAKQKADMYARMARECDQRLDIAGYNKLRLALKDGTRTLVEFFHSQRADEERLLLTCDEPPSQSSGT